MATVSRTPGTSVAMTITNLHSRANSATAGWQSARVDNTTEKAAEFDVNVKIDLANTAAANDKAIYVYLVRWYYDGSTWYPGSDGGTATLPSGIEGTYTIGATHNLVPIKTLAYTATDQVVQGQFTIKDPGHGWSLVVINYTGAAIASSGSVINYAPIHYTSA